MSSTPPARTTPRQAGGLRDVAREAVSGRIAAVAVDLFAECGFDQVTVEQIAAAVGISARSFHRYFPAKEDAVIGDPAQPGRVVCAAFAARPLDEPVWTSLRESYRAVLTEADDHDGHGKRIMRVLNASASLRARNLEKHLLWAEMLTPLVARRLGPDQTVMRARTLVQASLACFDVALAAWAADGESSSAGQLLDKSFAALSAAP